MISLALVSVLVTTVVFAAGTSPQVAVPYESWAPLIRAGKCSRNHDPIAHIGISCREDADGAAHFLFPPGIFELGGQLLVPESVTLTGAADPNDWSDPAFSPDWAEQTLFLSTNGATDYEAAYCYADDMITTRAGFVLSSFVTVERVAFQGVDTIRPADNGALCGGGAFETKGCALNDCSNGVNNGGSDGLGSTNVTIRDVRLNDFYFGEDEALVGAPVEGNYDCEEYGGPNCCFCKPNGVRTSQVGVWVPLTRDEAGTRHLTVERVVSRSNQADGINLHGAVTDATVSDVHFENTGDDVFAVWAGDRELTEVTWTDCVAVNPGILRPNWYGNCVATYGLTSVTFEGLTCRAPTLSDPIPDPQKPDTSDRWRIDTSMFVFYSSFYAEYPPGNDIQIRGWTFTDLEGNAYTAEEGTMDAPAVEWEGKMVWTNSVSTGVVAPYYIPIGAEEGNMPNVYAYPT